LRFAHFQEEGVGGADLPEFKVLDVFVGDFGFDALEGLFCEAFLLFYTREQLLHLGLFFCYFYWIYGGCCFAINRTTE
jgi:hypothetical protein